MASTTVYYRCKGATPFGELRWDGVVSTGRVLLIAGEGSAWGARIASHLGDLGFSPMCVIDANEAWRALARESFDVIIVEATGDLAEGCLACRALRPRFGVPIVVLGSKNDARARLNSYRAGADVYMAAPFDMLELVARISGIVRRSRRPAGVDSSWTSRGHALPAG